MIAILMHLIGFLASFPVAIAALFLFLGDINIFIQLTVGIITTTIIIFLLRLIFRRERPNVDSMKKSFFSHLSRSKLNILTKYVEDVEKRSFASSHVARIIVFGVVLYLNNFEFNYIMYLGIFAVVMAIARVYVKRHVFIDIITGTIIGAISGYFGYYAFNQFIFQFI